MADMVHHYLQRGMRPREILGLPLSDLAFYRASMELQREEDLSKLKALLAARR